MKKPTIAVEQLREFCNQPLIADWCHTLLAYLDALPDWIGEWPADLTRERLEELAECVLPSYENRRMDALRALAAIAPQRKKRMVNLWQKGSDTIEAWPVDNAGAYGWRKVGGPVEIEE